MAYPNRLLDPDESVVVDLHPHWWNLVRPASALVIAIVASIATLLATDVGTGGRTAATWVSLAGLALGASWLVSRYVRWAATEFVVTSRRVIFRTGVVRKRGIEVPLDRITTVHFRQGLFERIVGAGDLTIESGSEEQCFTDVRQPIRVQRAIYTEIEAREQRRSTGNVVDVAAQLERLESMVERGVLDAEQFERQKRRLLGM